MHLGNPRVTMIVGESPLCMLTDFIAARGAHFLQSRPGPCCEVVGFDVRLYILPVCQRPLAVAAILRAESKLT